LNCLQQVNLKEISMTRLASFATVTSVFLAACAVTTVAQAQAPASAMNGVLVGPSQMTLYVFDKDAAGSGKSVCNGGCATNWPPLMVTPGAKATGDWSLVARDNGDQQWAYKGRPLYYWAKDAKPGDRTGDGLLNNSWHIAKP
jgi:predicted lipoprotein with Yx(FWY)xxD motif